MLELDGQIVERLRDAAAEMAGRSSAARDLSLVLDHAIPGSRTVALRRAEVSMVIEVADAAFRTLERSGVIRHPEDKNAALLPHRIDGRWALLHRPKTQFGGAHGEIRLSALTTSLECARAGAATARGCVVCGLLHDAPSDEVRLDYGAADSSICVATARLGELLGAVMAAG